MVDACRAAGIPGRAAGVSRWHDDRGNHTWVEVWDGARWRFCGADEHDPAGLDRGWFTADAAKATAGDREHAVWASSWKREGATFPLAWARASERVAAVEVTSRYVKSEAGSDLAKLGSGGEELGEEAAGRLIDFLWKERRAALAEELEAEDEARAFEAAGQVLRIKERRFGDAPEGERSLWISMHGGGGAPPELNDGQWNNQIRLYEPEEGFYVAPRAPTNTWNLWHQGHIDPLFDRMIASYVARHGVDPDRVYLMGYSAGGDGVYQLAPRMADRYAAAAMMAGHPNETRPDGLRNLPFMIFMGGKDGAYDRNKIAARWKETLQGLADEDEGGYEHLVTIYPDKGHWMDREDRSALLWMAAKRRDPWPSKVVWLQDDVRGNRFYWLEARRTRRRRRRARVVAEVKGQTIAIEAQGLDRIALRLRDNLVDLDKDVVVTFDGERHSSCCAPVRPSRQRPRGREDSAQRVHRAAGRRSTDGHRCPARARRPIAARDTAPRRAMGQPGKYAGYHIVEAVPWDRSGRAGEPRFERASERLSRASPEGRRGAWEAPLRGLSGGPRGIVRFRPPEPLSTLLAALSGCDNRPFERRVFGTPRRPPFALPRAPLDPPAEPRRSRVPGAPLAGRTQEPP